MTKIEKFSCGTVGEQTDKGGHRRPKGREVRREKKPEEKLEEKSKEKSSREWDMSYDDLPNGEGRIGHKA